MGWLGWTPDIAMGADVNMIQLALEGRDDLLKRIFGTGQSEAKPPRKMTAEGFRAFAARHNARFARKQRDG